ncbi:hypothetical protein VHEMI00539 [[Torrubiella] hemipterigena]|uniref:Pentatricopeptide repeat-containing protein-mitochondrial domain-containing protein n=1 Tax=[Torrubiella] hemipterigena TaxID=1531966 RepID=A0A0A1T2M2_9HYPO|nr:hypothetical protein VHEMI00539 [[Torrubiella] hemipterigena]
MRQATIVNDGLWRCLCPRFEPIATTRLRYAPARQLIPSKPSQRSFAAQAAPNRNTSPTDSAHTQKNRSSFTKSRGSRSTTVPGSTDFAQWQRLLLGAQLPHSPILSQAPVEFIERAIDELRTSNTQYPVSSELSKSTRMTELLTHLLHTRRAPLTAEVYDAMIACTAETSGHSNFVRRLLKEMRLAKIPVPKAVLTTALEALSNHPNHILSAEIVEMMLESDMIVDGPVNQTLLLGLLRDGQHELAFSRLMRLRDSGETVDAWVYTIFIIEFGSQGYIDEALELLQSRRALAEDDDYPNIVYYLLDSSASRFHHAGTCGTWEQMRVDARCLLPDGILENVMGTAARYGNTELATAVLDIISKRQRTHGFHYEMVAEAQLYSKDVVGAMRVYSVMQQTDLAVTQSTVSQFRQLLLNEPELLQASEAALAELRQERTIPPAVLVAIIEVKAKMSCGEDALELYNRMLELTGAEAGAPLTQDMLCLCTTRTEQSRLARVYQARFERATQDPVRPAAKLSNVISKLADIEELDLALRLAEPMLEDPEQLKHHGSWVEGVVETAVSREDSRVWRVVDAVSKSGNSTLTFTVQKLLNQGRMTKRADELKGR